MVSHIHILSWLHCICCHYCLRYLYFDHTVKIRIQARDVCKRRDLEMWPSWGLEPPFVSFISLLPLVACAPCILSLVPSLLASSWRLRQFLIVCLCVCLCITCIWMLFLPPGNMCWLCLCLCSCSYQAITCTLATFSNFILCSSALLCLYFFVSWTVLCHYDWLSLFVFVSPVPFCATMIQYDNAQ